MKIWNNSNGSTNVCIIMYQYLPIVIPVLRKHFGGWGGGGVVMGFHCKLLDLNAITKIIVTSGLNV